MANPFGSVVDNDKLDEIIRYESKNKTQEDRAREAMNLIGEDDKNSKAREYVESVKSDYGDGVTTLCMVYNATGDTINYVAQKDWLGNIGRTPYPISIGNGQWGSFLHVHPTSQAYGSMAAVVYRGKNVSGEGRDFMISWNTPWGPWYSNSAYTEVGAVDNFESRWDEIYKKLENSGKSSTDDSDGSCVSTADIGNGTSPLFTATLKIKFSP